MHKYLRWRQTKRRAMSGWHCHWSFHCRTRQIRQRDYIRCLTMQCLWQSAGFRLCLEWWYSVCREPQRSIINLLLRSGMVCFMHLLSVQVNRYCHLCIYFLWRVCWFCSKTGRIWCNVALVHWWSVLPAVYINLWTEWTVHPMWMITHCRHPVSYFVISVMLCRSTIWMSQTVHWPIPSKRI